ncbi:MULTISPECIES: NADH:flavin oxidoreductase/NADH oxidase family protein [Marinobacter]|jgi:2,4-dienoyl-CoA reductase-like NADH-dependent reductase (Old Yellow Enzyme family)|uniref:NADH:flavin oxidoreductase/NADH oxidase family protein n=1 Tax=Marinobacter TaxID=2742 RepID=UPI00200442F8|nr:MULTISPECIES: NADH:flavin oxidoreductase/NADH oxidase family protein [Marinobacter]MCK7550236.1 NADH:flavin oxidoreductase/NADH oxidase family protein [Marinobacter goseongensis]MDV3502577.1 NADH:flavin oxidoreductase/NADH oxidase family protein [Marinobacter sp. M-5]
MKPAEILSQPLTLKTGSVIPNRFAKSAMSETLGTIDNRVTKELVTLYRTWAEGGTGLSITGNVMVDRRHIGEPQNVVLEDERDLVLLRAWADAGKTGGNQIWMQLNHPGKQSPKMLNSDTVAPSAIPFKKELRGMFATPRALTGTEIEEIVLRFARSAAIAEKAGFDGVQIHGAHGYLVSQFLSPHHNQRTDEWGGSAENRMRFVLEVYRAIRAVTGDGFNVGIKLNSADFQRGGFTEEESLGVIDALAKEGIDLVEISGGNYENPAMAKGAEGGEVKQSTLAREAYFLEFAEKVRERVEVPLMVTGGFRTETGMADAVTSGATDLVGIARPLAVEPDCPKRIMAGESFTSAVRPIKTGIRLIDDMALMEVSWYTRQLGRIGKGKAPRTHDRGMLSLLEVIGVMATRGVRTRLRAGE